MKNNTNNEGGYMNYYKLEKNFLELQQECSFIHNHKLLMWVIAFGNYENITIDKAVDNLIKECDYCGNYSHTYHCGKPHSKEELKRWLLINK